MNKYGWLVGLLGAFFGGIFALYRRHYLERLPEEHELSDFMDLPPPVLEDPRPPVRHPEAPTSPTQPIPKPIPPMPTKEQRLITFCTAIRDFEGKPGDANYRNNNPGNFRKSPVGYAAMYGNVRVSPNGFAIFPTYELGWQYLLNTVRNRIKRHPTWTFRDFFFNYAPPSDHNPSEAYARNVAKRCGVAVGSKVSDYLA